MIGAVLAGAVLVAEVAGPAPPAAEGESRAPRPDEPARTAAEPDFERSESAPERKPAVFATDPESPPPASPTAHTKTERLGGDYWGLTEQPRIRPPDGDDEIIAGSIILPLGILNATTGSLFTFATHASNCPEVPQQWFRIELSRGQCRNMFVLNTIRTAYGGLQITAGAVALAVGLYRRARYREAEARGFALTPVVDPSTGYLGANVRARF